MILSDPDCSHLMIRTVFKAIQASTSTWQAWSADQCRCVARMNAGASKPKAQFLTNPPAILQDSEVSMQQKQNEENKSMQNQHVSTSKRSFW